MSDTFLDLFNPLESRKKNAGVCFFLFRRGGSDEEVQREQTAPPGGEPLRGLRLFLEVRICNALLCSTKVSGGEEPFSCASGLSALLLRTRGFV